VLLPHANRRDLVELPATLRHDLELVTVERMDEVVERALLPAARAAGPTAPRVAPRPGRRAAAAR